MLFINYNNNVAERDREDRRAAAAADAAAGTILGVGFYFVVDGDPPRVQYLFQG